jgi:hypothetical protein
MRLILLVLLELLSGTNMMYSIDNCIDIIIFDVYYFLIIITITTIVII